MIVGNTTPKVGTDVDKIPGTIVPKRSDLWAQYDEPGTACTGGITVDPSDIGTWTGTPGVTTGGLLTHEICTGSASCTTTENVFRVTARHVPNTGGIVPWDVRARVRIAAWGSQPAYWDDALWQDVTNTQPLTTDILLGPTTPFTTANGWYWAPPVDALDGTSAVTIDYKCNKGANAFCPQLADMSELHQCILAEISQPSGAWPISTAAAYQNMDYQTLSSHERQATISIAGLKKILGEDQDRDVYLYIDEHNLPQVGEKPFELPLKDMAQAREIAEHPIRLPTVPGKPPVPIQVGTRGPVKPVRPVKPVLAGKPAVNTPGSASRLPERAGRHQRRNQRLRPQPRVLGARGSPDQEHSGVPERVARAQRAGHEQRPAARCSVAHVPRARVLRQWQDLHGARAHQQGARADDAVRPSLAAQWNVIRLQACVQRLGRRGPHADQRTLVQDPHEVRKLDQGADPDRGDRHASACRAPVHNPSRRPFTLASTVAVVESFNPEAAISAGSRPPSA